ncbi:MAG: sensor domain-containing diguanylate cyclase, partial [Planctomycetota bacterium]
RIAAGLSSRDPFGRQEGLDRSLHVTHSVAAAAACRELAGRLKVATAEDAHTSGLLHAVGQMVFDLGDRRRYAKVVEAAGSGERPLAEVEEELLGTHHGRAGAFVAKRWNFPRVLCDVVRHHGHVEQLPDDVSDETRVLVELVAAANAILSGGGISTCCGNGRSTGTVAGREVSDGDAEAALVAARDAMSELRALLELDMVGGETLHSALAEASASGGDSTGIMAIHRPSLRDAAAHMTEALRAIRACATSEEAWEAGLLALRGAMGADRVLYFSYDAERSRLELRHGHDDTGLLRSGELPTLDLPVTAAGPLAHAMKDGHAVLLDDMGTDAPLLRDLGVSQVAASPVDLLGRTHGLLVSDNLFSGRVLEDHDSAMMGILSAELALGIENLLLHKQTAKLRSLAERDELTGVNNRRNLMALFQRELDRARRYGSQLSVAMVDIDFFKSFNDTYGHQAGDEVLRTISQVLVAASREIDIIGRYGGEEFVALLPETGISQASVYAERLRRRVELRGEDLLSRFDKTKPLTISVGLTQALPRDGDDIELVIARVDTALYDAKEQGRNRVVVADLDEEDEAEA